MNGDGNNTKNNRGNSHDGHAAWTTTTAPMSATAFDDESLAMVSRGRLQRAVAALLRAEPALLAHPAVQQARQVADWLAPANSTNKKNKKTTNNNAAEASVAYLNALAACLVHDALRWAVLRHLRAFALDLLARLMDGSTLTLYEQLGGDASYAVCSDNLKRREAVASALVALLAFLPQTKHQVLQYFAEAPCFFEYVSIAATQPQQATPAVRARLGAIVRVAFRLLQLYPQDVAPIWNWASFYPLCFHDDLRVRWYAARATALVLRMSNKQRNAFLRELLVGEEAAVASHHNVVRQIEIDEHRFEIAHQQQRVELVLSSDSTAEAGDAAMDEDHRDQQALRPVPFHETLTNVFGVVIPTKRAQEVEASSSTSLAEALVPTASTKRNLQAMAIALGLKRPVLIAGSGGCGKTAVIRELARLSGNTDMVELHLDDQIDSKTLLGSYVCTDIPGEFTWQPGALTTAVLEGRWVVIEDIDRAPFEVLAALMPLLETREMVLPGRGELLVAHSNFQIFATTSHGHNMPKGFQESIWARVDVQPLHDDEVEAILTQTFSRIPQHVITKIMTTFNAVSGKEQVEGTSSAIWKETRRNYGRDFSLRDLLKWCKRIYSFCYTSNHHSGGSGDYVTEVERLRIVVEACDVFCAGVRDPNTRVLAAIAIGSIWQVPEEKIRYTMDQHKPAVKFSTHEVEIGRVHLPTMNNSENEGRSSSSSFVMTGHVLRLLEKLAVIVHTCEPALLIGETGCGKTTVIQHLAASMGQTLVVQNLNIQSDSSDLVGGFKPVELHLLARPLYMSFVDLFTATFSQKSNAAFLNIVRVAFEQKDWKKMSKGMKKALQMANAKLYGDESSAEASKMASKGASLTVMKARWDTFDAEVSRFERQKEQVESHFAFAFVEGVLVKALREGHWVLLDEINLASSDTLERISTLLEHEKSAFSLTERGDVEIIRPHPNFRLFGAMNPSTDVGKKDLPPSLRNRFTEIYVDECVSPTDLQMVVQNQFREIMSAPVMETVRFYLEARKQAEERLSDGARHKPRYSLRTLSQALQITRILIQRGYGMSRALYEGFSSTFCTLLDLDSRLYLDNLIRNTFAKTMKAKELKREPPCPGGQKMVSEYVLVSSYWVRKGDFMDPRDDSLPDPVTSRKKFVLTPSVDENLRHVARAALIGRYPVLLQGPTSAGKTSLISYLAARIGQKCVRINNHEHTDIQEYLGSYVSDSNGKLTFKEGVLVEAVRNGWWIILDELNLAPSEVLEALNRLLDDNRELFLPETQETVKPHPKFMLFATQNPPGLYGGRKVLSRAFRNRFMEIQVDEAPTKELQVILQERSSLPPSYCGILIDIMRQLQMVRQQSSIFAGKSGFITTRDLLRWAERRPSTKQALAEEGYCLLAERLRKDEEKEVVKKVIEQKCNVTIDIDEMYYRGEARDSNLLNENGDVEVETVWGSNEQFERVQRLVEEALTEGGDGKSEGNAAGLDKVSVTKALRRLFALVGRCLQHEEPVLLVGETGCGKTTVCQLYSLLFNQPLHIINCHQHTETSDFLGCLRPVRGKEKIANDLHEALVAFLSARNAYNAERSSIADMLALYETISVKIRKESEMEDVEAVAALEKIEDLRRRYQSIFEWCDGPLVESMKKGDLILIDEVNLAEDAVLERLNSVLEPSRTLLLAEKGGDQVEEIVAHQKWRVMATMNPGGDFGKRELSPALRNRFTEIWVPAISDLEDIATIIRDRLVGRSVAGSKSYGGELSFLCDPILAFVKKFNEKNGGLAGCGAVTLRDILSWINFICSVMKKQSGSVSAWTAFVQGAALSVLDGLGLGSDKALHTALKARDEAYEYLLELVPSDDESAREEVLQSLHATKQAVDDKIAGLNSADERHFGIGPFMIPRGPDAANGKEPPFSLRAPTTMSNLYRVLRAMQVSRPIILEGSPGVGKTSLISALAAASGHRLVRINLSEQTDISDLFGSDLPAASNGEAGEGSSGAKGMFEWCDGVFLRALKAGDWVLLDELNLASQSVLEGLNSCLDHRGTVYIPELDREFECPPTFRVFAAQNPLRQGGGRKGLPKSFLNRFTRVFVDMLHEGDLTQIAASMYPQLDVLAPTPVTAEADASEPMEVESTILQRMIQFNSTIHSDTMEDCTYGRLGAPWEFNLRDVFRFCELIAQDGEVASFANETRVLDTLRYYVNFIYLERMRSPRDRAFVAQRFAQFFGGAKPLEINNVALRVGESYVQIGRAFIKRRDDQLRVSRVVPPVFNFLLKPMEALIHCVNMSWPALLVGPPGSGKTSAVRLLAALSGNKLHELGMSAGTDATELLGCFEQVDLGRKLREHRDELAEIFDAVVEALLRKGASAGAKSTKYIKQARHLTNQWFALTKHERDESESPSSPRASTEKKKRKQVTKGQLDSVVVGLMIDIISALLKAIPAVDVSKQHVSELQRIEQRIQGVVQMSKGSASSVASSFEWVDGTLIQAMERGEWILLDNVNFCSSSVLDRLNSLMETGGELLINECGVINGKLRVIKPHPNFRIFLAMDPQFGEVSRAMRNRCVEIALVESADEQPRDVVAMAAAAGVPGFKLGRGFQRVHRAIEQGVAQHSAMGARMLGRFSRRHLENWAMLSSREMERGVPALLAIDRAFDRVYGSADDLLTYLHLDKAALLTTAFSGAIGAESSQGLLALPVASTFELCQRAESVMLKRDFAYADYLLRTSTQQRSSEDQLLGSLNSSDRRVEAEVSEKDRDMQLVDFVQLSCEQERLDVLCPSEAILETAQRHLTSIEFFPFGGSTLSVLYAPFALRRVVQALASSSRVVTEDRLLFAMETLVGTFTSTDEASADASAYLLYRYLRSLLLNKSFKVCGARFRSALTKLLETIAPQEAVASEQFPVFLAGNEAAYRYLETLVSTHRHASSDVTPLWETLVSVQSQLELIDGVEWLRFCEEEQYSQIDALMAPNAKKESHVERSAKRVKTQAGFDGDLSGFSVLQQSYAVHQYHADRSAIANSDVVFLIFPLLKSFDAWMASVLERERVTDVESLKRVIRDRFEFSIQMRDNAFDWTHFLIHWQVVKKSLQQIPEDLTKSPQWEDVVDMQQRVNDAIEKVIGCASHKNTLWKSGGHALLPRSRTLWHAKYLLERLTKTHMQLGGQHFSSAMMCDRPQQVDVLALLFGGIASMEAAMKSGQLDVSALFYVDAPTRREILHALCAFSFVTKQQEQQKQGGGVEEATSGHAMMAEELIKVPDVLLKKLDDSKTLMTSLISSKTLYLSELEDTSANQHLLDFINSEDADGSGGRVGRDAPIMLFDMKESANLMGQLVNFQLAPLKEHALARQEVAIIGQLLHVVNVGHTTLKEELSDSSNEHALQLVRLIRDAMANVEAFVDGVVEVGMRSPTTFHAYQDIVWCGHRFTSIESMPEGPELTAELRAFVGVLKTQLNGVLFGFHSFLRENSFNAMEGIALEIFDTRNKLQKSRTGKKRDDEDVEAHHKVVYGLPRVFQSVGSAVVLRSIAEVELHQSKCATIETQVRSVRMQKIKEHLRSVELRQREQLSIHLSTRRFLKELFVFTVMAFESSFHGHQRESASSHELLLGWLSSTEAAAGEDRKQLIRMLRSSTDVGFAGLADKFAVPLLDQLTQPVDAEREALLLGKSLILVGLWRFLLFLPSTPVDPVTKPLVKKEMLMNRVAMQAFQTAVDSAIERFAPRTDGMGASDHANQVRHLTDQVRHVSVFAIQRYNPENVGADGSVPAVGVNVFGDLFRDLLRFQKTIMPVDKLLGFVSVVQSLSGRTKSMQMLRELEMFQQTTDNFAAHVTKKFGSSFYDIVEPIVASIGSVKEGVAMLAWHIQHTLQETSVPDADKSAMALALMRFPRSPAPIDDSNNEVFGLIRLVGSKASALAASSGSLASKKATDVALLNVALIKMAQQFKETLAHASSLSTSASYITSSAESVLRSSKVIFDLFLTKWQEQKQREEEKRLEEEALFKYRTRNVEIESEDQLLEEEFRQQFPDYVSKEFSVFLTAEQAAAAAASAGQSATVNGDVWISDSLIQELCEMHTQLYAAVSASGSSSFSRKLLIDAFARGYSLAVNMRRSINAMVSAEIEQVAVGSGLFAASLVESRLHVGQAPHMSALNSEYIRGVDFHRDPLVKEAVLAVQPLQNLLLKVQRLLALWPEHAILQQIVLIADRIRNFEISSPLVRTLTAIELLVRKAQEWEAYAAREYSIADDLKALSMLITRWRKLELYSWPHLLHVKEKQHRGVANKTWFNMYSLLTAQFEGDADMKTAIESATTSVSKKELQWLYLSDVTNWVFISAKSGGESTALVAVSEEQKKWRSELFSTLDAYVRSCPMGQYESRLLIVYAFCCQLFMEVWHDNESEASNKSAKHGLANVLYNLYRYYAQHLEFLDRQWSALKAPIQKQLIEFVKICKWDEQTYYSLEESAEKSHRKLMKFVRDYDAVLSVTMQTVIDASSDNSISKEGGYSGIVATKNELDRCDDSVFIPAIESPKPTAPTEPVEGDQAPAKEVEEPKKAVVAEPEGAPSAGVIVVVTHSGRDALTSSVEDIAPLLSTLSSYATKIPGFVKRIGKYTKQQILSLDQVKQRQLSREICEDICSTIFYRMALLQNDGNVKEGPRLPKGSKKKALIDLLAELKVQGLSYHRMQLPHEQHQMEQLFALDVPDVENCIQVDGLNDLIVIHEDEDAAAMGPTMMKKGKKLKKTKKLNKKKASKKSSAGAQESSVASVDKDTPLWLWRRADDYYYRFVSQIASLRFSSLTQFSHDLSSSEVDRMNGYAENMLYRMVQHRQMVHASSLSHENLLLGLTRLRELHSWKQNYMSDELKVTGVPVKVAIEWQKHQQGTAALLREPLRELEIVVSQVLRTTSTPTTGTTPATSPLMVKGKFDSMLLLLDEITSSFESRDLESGRVLRKSLGVPGIPYHTTLSSDELEREGNGGLVAFAHPQKRVHGLSPLVVPTSSEPVVIPVSESVLRANSAKMDKVHASLLEIKAAFSLVAPTASFDPVLSALDSAVKEEASFGTAAMNIGALKIEEDSNGAAVEQSMKQFAEQHDKLVSTVLVAIQDLTKEQPIEKEAVAEEEEEENATLREQILLLTSSIKNARIHPIATQLNSLLDTVSQQYAAFLEGSCASSLWRKALNESFALLEAIEPMVVDMRGISRQLLADLLVTHKSVTKLDYILIRIFRNLFQHGFCRAADEKDEEEGGSGDGKTKFTDDVEGTGMGEGEGKKDVSNEIEDEEQLLGLKGDENEQKPPEAGEKPEDTGLEMQNDFDGTMHDVPDDEKDDNDDKNSDDEEELDREMGDFDQDDENVVDEKKWGDDSDDDEDDIDKENEKFEDDSRMDQSEAIEDEIRGKDDDETPDDKKKKNKEDDKAAKEKEPASDQQSKDDDMDEGGGSDEDEDDEEEKKDPVNDDFEDNYEEKHDQVDPNSRDGEQEDEKEEGEQGDELPENMQLDDGEDDGGNDGDNGDDPNDEDESMSDVGDETNADTHEEDDEEQKEDEENEEPLDNSVQLGAGGLDDEVDAPEDEDAPEPEKDEVKTEDDASEQQKSSSAVAGTQSKDGVDEIEQEETAQDEAMDENPQKRDEDDANDDNQDQTKSSSMSQNNRDDDDKQEWRPSSQVDTPQENEEQKRNRRKQEPNPYRNPQNAQEHWKRRVEMIKRDNKDDDANDDGSKRDGDKEQEMTTAELLDDDEEMEDAQHALAPAEENQVMNQQNQQNEDEVDDAKKDEERNDGAGASAMEIDDEEDKESQAKDENETEDKPKPKTEDKTPKPDRDHKAEKNKTADADKQAADDAAQAKAEKEDEDVDMDETSSPFDGAVTALRPPTDENKRDDEDDAEDDDARPMPKLLSAEEVTALRDELDASIAAWSRSDLASRGTELWSKYTAITMGSSQRLCEQLRLVLEPMLRAKLEGDFRTGKRINMRKVIPYIASQFRKDKIWMRRTRPSKRAYQIMVAIDDSESMADNHAGRLALEAMTTLCKALTQLEVGEISVVKFGEDIQLLHAFDASFTDDAGSRVITQFGFQQKKTNMISTLDAILQILETAKLSSHAASASNVEFTQIVFLISDGRFDTDGRSRIKKLIEKALEQQQLIVLLVVDQAEQQESSILETKSVTFAKGKVEMVPYLENYPFPYYAILPTSVLLPEILSDSLRQWFEMLQMKQ